MLSVQQFSTKKGMTPRAPLSLFIQSGPKLIFCFVSLDEKSSQENVLLIWKRWNKTAEALKGIKINKFENCSEQWEKISVGVSHQMESTLKVTEV